MVSPHIETWALWDRLWRIGQPPRLTTWLIEGPLAMTPANGEGFTHPRRAAVSVEQDHDETSIVPTIPSAK